MIKKMYVLCSDIHCVKYAKALHTAQKMKFSIKDFFSKCDQILWIWSHLLKKSWMENFVFYAASFDLYFTVYYSVFIGGNTDTILFIYGKKLAVKSSHFSIFYEVIRKK